MPEERPNILVITTDQQRFDTVLPWRPPWLRTPHLDDLQRQGVSFTRAYADAPICVPGRMALLTGKFVRNHGMPGNGHTSEYVGNRDTLPARMADIGYQTAAVGKLHFHPQRARHGFGETWIPQDYFNEMARAGSPLQSHRHGLGANELHPGMATVPECMTLTSWIAEKSAEFIRERRDPTVPFFLWTSFSKPHPPLDPPEPYCSMYRDCPIPEPTLGDWSGDEEAPESFKRHRQCWSADLLSPEVIREARAAYYGLVTQIDYNIGRIFAALFENRLFDNTLIVFYSDHGEYLGDFRNSGKMFFHEVSAHIPMIVRMPKTWENRRHGTSCDALATIADVPATLLRAAGDEPPDDYDGQDLIGVARGEIPPRGLLDCVSYGDVDADRASIAITDGRWKYLWFPEGGGEQLFDLESDPKEERNLAGLPERAGKKQELKGELARRHEGNPFGYAKGGKLVAKPLRGDTVRDRRNAAHPGYISEHWPHDTKH